MLKKVCLKTKVSEFLDRYNLWDKTLLVGFSGGADSSCLLDILYNLMREKKTLNLVALHYNHNWRGETANQEQENCRIFCKERGIEFYTETAPDNIKKNETEARELRYAFFERGINIYLDKYKKDVVVLTAHNWDDNAETILYRIAKGTGIVGLKGILPNREKYYRPLLDISRKDIEKYCCDNNIYPNYDDSNEDTVHKRNLIRHELIPLFEKINPDVKKVINSLGKIAVSECSIIDEYMLKISEDLYEDGKIKTKVFSQFSDSVKQRVIYNLIYNSEFDYTMETVLNICEFINKTIADNKPSKYSLNKDTWLYVDRNIIEIITKPLKTDEVVEINKTGDYKLSERKFRIEHADEYRKTDSESTVYADLSGFKTLYIRTRRDGDVIQPLGSKGHMKLKKYLMSKNIPQHKRDNLLLLTDGVEILWVGGVGMSDKIKVIDRPTHMLSVE